MKQQVRFEISLLFATAIFCANFEIEQKEKNLKKQMFFDSIEIGNKEDKFISKIVSGRVSKTISKGEYSEKSSIYFEYFTLNDKSPKYLESVNELISESLHSDFEELNNYKITSDLSKKYFADILTNFEKSFCAVGAIVPWSIMDSIRIDNSKSKFTHLETFTYSYTGGAHGNGNESHYLIDKESGKKLTISSVFKNVKKLNSLVDAYFRKSVDLSPNDNFQDEGWFIEDKLVANNNFFFRNNKVVFVYNAYEIAPYSVGITHVKIPLSKLENLLKLKLN